MKPGGLLVHPYTLAALALWIVNDHYLKRTHGSWITGKLSDVACLIVVPLIGIAAVELYRNRLAALRTCLLFIAATGVIMISINLFDSAAWIYQYGLAIVQWPLRALHGVIVDGALPSIRAVQKTMDPTDLLTLPALLVPTWLVLRMHRR
jgi:hypothetical protein